MTCSRTAMRRLGGLATAIVLAQLAGCASTPSRRAAPAVGPPPPFAPSRPAITMAPIPNPSQERPAPRERPARSHPAATGAVPAKHAPRPAPARDAAPPAGAPVDPARAAQLRTKGLEELNRGQVARAVALLAQASQLDPGSSTIRRDLERAQRIDRAVHGPH